MPKKPNLLFIFTDQQRCDTLECYGNERIETHSLNRLAGESFVFDNAYVTQPVCTPSRSSIMTGLYPHSTGCTQNNNPLRPHTRTIAETVCKEYHCGYFGKWHLGDEVIAQHGFEEWVSIEDYYRRYYTKEDYLTRLSSYHHFLVEKGFTPDGEASGAKVFGRSTAARFPEHFTKAAFLGREAARFIRENRSNPFVLYVNFLEPHNPWTGPFDGLYPPDELPAAPHFNRKPPENASLINRLLADFWSQSGTHGFDLTTEAGWRGLRARYWGLVTLVDRAVGVILGALEECSLADDTIVVFTSDHGDMMGDHSLLAKCVQYEEALRVPLLMRVPWLGRKRQHIEGRISQIDLAPTLLELMNEPIPQGLEGESRVPVLYGDAALEGNDIFIEWNGDDGRPSSSLTPGITDEELERVREAPWRTVISPEGWKLNLSAADRCELYNLSTDPYEQVNLFDDPGQKDRIRDLTARIRQWQQRTGDVAPLLDA